MDKGSFSLLSPTEPDVFSLWQQGFAFTSLWTVTCKVHFSLRLMAGLRMFDGAEHSVGPQYSRVELNLMNVKSEPCIAMLGKLSKFAL